MEQKGRSGWTYPGGRGPVLMGLTLEGPGGGGGAPEFRLGAAGLVPGTKAEPEAEEDAELWPSAVPFTWGLGLGSGLAALLPWLGVEPLEEAARDKH